MIKHETAFLATMLLPGPYLVPTLFGILPYPSLIPPYMYKEIATQYPCITLPLPVQDVVSSMFQVIFSRRYTASRAPMPRMSGRISSGSTSFYGKF
ncbi:MAG: hypothetical protein EOM62_02935 [Bacteroidia bacterium]|nr:hypothetical protein [Bacteroidia bacterium]